MTMVAVVRACAGTVIAQSANRAMDAAARVVRAMGVSSQVIPCGTGSSMVRELREANVAVRRRVV